MTVVILPETTTPLVPLKAISAVELETERSLALDEILATFK
jgi:hypothetical protein